MRYDFFKYFAGKGKKSSLFSDFFLHAPETKKREVLAEAARRANEEQMEVFRKSRFAETSVL